MVGGMVYQWFGTAFITAHKNIKNQLNTKTFCLFKENVNFPHNSNVLQYLPYISGPYVGIGNANF